MIKGHPHKKLAMVLTNCANIVFPFLAGAGASIGGIISPQQPLQDAVYPVAAASLQHVNSLRYNFITS